MGVEMNNRDAEIICGEWETGDTPMDFRSEKYNVVLRVKEIVRHPNYNADVGPGEGSDLAVFKVDDTTLANSLASPNEDLPSLPTIKRKENPYGWIPSRLVHAAFSLLPQAVCSRIYTAHK